MSNDSTIDLTVNTKINQPTSEDTPKPDPKDPTIQAYESVHKEPYYARTHADLVENLDISPLAIFLLTYLCKQSATWVVPQSRLKERLRCGRTKLESLFSELRKAGYVKYVKIRAKNGTIVGSKRIFSRLPEFLNTKPNTEAPETGVMDTHRGSKNPGPGKLEPNTNIKTNSTNIKTNTYVASDLSGPDSLIDEDILFEFYKVELNHPKSKLSEDKNDLRRRRLRKYLKEYGMSDCKKAILGCKGSDFHMGRLPGQPKKYNILRNVFGDPDVTDKFIEMFEEGPGNPEGRAGNIMKGTI